MGLMFSKWLVAQCDRKDWISDLAKMAAKDRAFPKAATGDQVRAYLSAAGADPDLFEVLDDAERAYANAYDEGDWSVAA